MDVEQPTVVMLCLFIIISISSRFPEGWAVVGVGLDSYVTSIEQYRRREKLLQDKPLFFISYSQRLLLIFHICHYLALTYLWGRVTN